MIFGISDTAIGVIYDHQLSRFWFDRCPRTMPASFGAQVVIGAADAFPQTKVKLDGEGAGNPFKRL